MPIYEYTCTSCGTRFPKLQRVGADSTDVRCPSCSSDDVQREISGFSSGSSSSATAGSAPGCGNGGFT